MRGYYAFMKKELTEQLRTYKWMIILAVFFIFGMMSPLAAKLLPDLLSSVDMQGIKLEIPVPTANDAYGQFFKNFTQMGMLAVLLVFGGVLSNELSRGTLVNILAKGLPRHTVLLSKFTASVILWTVGYLLAALTTYGYTAYLFENAAVEHLIFSFFCLWVFGCFVLALIFLSSTIAPGSFGGLILSAVALIGMIMVNSMFTKAEKFNPVTLASVNMNLITGTQEVNGLIPTLVITGILTALCMALSIIFFNKKKL